MSESEFATGPAWAILVNHAEDGPTNVGHVMLTLKAQVDPESHLWVSECVELKVHAYGAEVGSALDAAMDATIAYLNTVEQLGDRERVFALRNLSIREGSPFDDDVSVSIKAGEHARAMPAALVGCDA